MQSTQNSGVAKKKEAERIEFEKFANSHSFVIWKMNFKSEACSGSSFPTEAMVWINDADSARHMDELNSFWSILGRIIPDFEVLCKKISKCSQEVTCL